MDRRQQKTQRATFDALISLLEHKPYSKITVQEIIDAANIGRSTFYSHFETKDELLRALCADVFEHVFSDHPAKERTHDFSDDEQTIENEITHILYHLQDDRDSVRRLLSRESEGLFMSYLKDYVAIAFGERSHHPLPSVPEEYLANHLACSFAETVRWWMKQGKYTPEEVARFYLEVNPCLTS